MKLETPRLHLTPIGDEEMARLVENERDEALRLAYAEMLENCRREPENRIWHAVWEMKLKAAPETVVGDFSFKGLGADGTTEIGYGLREGFCGHGYMTEALRAVCAWAFTQNAVTRIEAETEPGNAASQKVLAACGFFPTGTFGKEGPRFALCRSAQKARNHKED